MISLRNFLTLFSCITHSVNVTNTNRFKCKGKRTFASFVIVVLNIQIFTHFILASFLFFSSFCYYFFASFVQPLIFFLLSYEKQKTNALFPFKSTSCRLFDAQKSVIYKFLFGAENFKLSALNKEKNTVSEEYQQQQVGVFNPGRPSLT